MYLLLFFILWLRQQTVTHNRPKTKTRYNFDNEMHNQQRFQHFKYKQKVYIELPRTNY